MCRQSDKNVQALWILSPSQYLYSMGMLCVPRRFFCIFLHFPWLCCLYFPIFSILSTDLYFLAFEYLVYGNSDDCFLVSFFSCPFHVWHLDSYCMAPCILFRAYLDVSQITKEPEKLFNYGQWHVLYLPFSFCLFWPSSGLWKLSHALLAVL